jgi:2-iminoacetate synthase
MDAFSLDPRALADTRERAAGRAGAGEAPGLLAALHSGERLDDEALATLLLGADVDTDELLDLARSRVGHTGGPLVETFSPLYLTNECDAECKMCGMRSFNRELQRETADEATVAAQLDVLHARGLRGIAVLTGEYHKGPRRREMIERATRTLHAALDRGFRHVLINIGALEEAEYDDLLGSLPRGDDDRVSPHVTMCTFQETYAPDVYAKFMGTSPQNPRADFERRLRNFDRAADAGMTSANPGVLLGLHRDVAYEVLALLAHVRHLQARGMSVYVSLPRLRKASGAEHQVGVDDDTLFRVVATMAIGAPEAKVVISTREPPAVQHRLLPVIGVLTPGSPGVAPYTETGARFELTKSQFEVLDERPIEAILGEILDAGATIQDYEPRPGA